MSSLIVIFSWLLSVSQKAFFLSFQLKAFDYFNYIILNIIYLSIVAICFQFEGGRKIAFCGIESSRLKIAMPVVIAGK